MTPSIFSTSLTLSGLHITHTDGSENIFKTATMNTQPNHFQFHGSIIYDGRRQMLEDAQFDGYRIVKNERYSDGSFVSDEVRMPTTFLHNGQLYYFLTTHHGAISDFFELNMSIEKCLSGEFGLYFEAIPISTNQRTLTLDPYAACQALQTAGMIEGFELDGNNEPVILYTDERNPQGYNGEPWHRFIKSFVFTPVMLK